MSEPLTENIGEEVPVSQECEDPSAAPEASFSQKQVNDIAAKEAAKALERLFRDLGYAVNGRAKEQQKEFVSEYWNMRNRLEELSAELENARTEIRSQLTQNEQQNAEYAALQAKHVCLRCGANPASVDDLVRMAPYSGDAQAYAASIGEILKKYPFFRRGPSEGAVPAPFCPEKTPEAGNGKFYSIAKKMGLV